MEGYLIFLTIGTIANLCLTGWVMLAVNETDRTNTRMMDELNQNIDRWISNVKSDIREMHSDIASDLNSFQPRVTDDSYD